MAQECTYMNIIILQPNQQTSTLRPKSKHFNLIDLVLKFKSRDLIDIPTNIIFAIINLHIKHSKH